MHTFSGHVWLVCIWSLFVLEVTGLRCFRCEDLRDASLCTVMDVCSDADQVCVTVKDLNDNYQISYRLGCVKKEVCDGPLMSVFKHSCCSSDYCNAYNLDDTTTSKQIATSTVQNIITNGGTPTNPTTKAEHIRTEATTIVTETTTLRIEATTVGTEATTVGTEANTNSNHITNQTSHAFNCSGHSFYQWHGHCYYITTHNTPWGVNRNGHHKDPCIGHNMHMVVIDSDEEHNAIVNFVQHELHYAGQVWLGASFSWDHNRRWHWTNGVGISAHDSHWQSQSEERQHQCLALSGSKWASISCSHHKKHLCEY